MFDRSDEFSTQSTLLMSDRTPNPSIPYSRIWTAGEPENDARTERFAQGGMMVPVPLQKNMMALRDARPGLKEKYDKFPFE